MRAGDEKLEIVAAITLRDALRELAGEGRVRDTSNQVTQPILIRRQG